MHELIRDITYCTIAAWLLGLGAQLARGYSMKSALLCARSCSIGVKCSHEGKNTDTSVASRIFVLTFAISDQ